MTETWAFSKRKAKNIDRIVPPWIDSPYSLFTWWDVKQLSEFHLYDIGFILGQIKQSFESLEGEAKKRGNSGLVWLTGEQKKLISKNLRTIRRQCEFLDLDVSIACIEEGLYDLRQELVKPQVIGKLYDELSRTIRRELQTTHFFYMPYKQTRFYRQANLFGSTVARKFPSLGFDIVEAGNCFAMGRPTACVFHLMRIMEVGTQTFGAALGVTFTDGKNWQNILDESNKAIKSLPRSPATVVFGQIAAHLYNVKVAWRNQVMHPHDKYTLDEAEELIQMVRSFMKQLATII